MITASCLCLLGSGLFGLAVLLALNAFDQLLIATDHSLTPALENDVAWFNFLFCNSAPRRT